MCNKWILGGSRACMFVCCLLWFYIGVQLFLPRFWWFFSWVVQMMGELLLLLGFYVCVWAGGYFIIYFVKILWVNHLCFPISYSIPPVLNHSYFKCVKHGLFVSFISSIAIDKRVRFIAYIAIALNSPSGWSSLPQSTITVLLVMCSYIALIMSILTNKYIFIPFTPLLLSSYELLSSKTCLLHHQVKA